MTITSTQDNDLVTTGDLIIPLIVNPRYQFQVDLEDNTYLFTVRWNVESAAWYLNIEGVSNTVDYKGIKLVTGVNLLKPYAILELGALYMIDNEEQGLDPDYDNIGSRYQLYYITTDNTDYIA